MCQENFAKFKKKEEVLRSALQRVKDKLNEIADSFNSTGVPNPHWDRFHDLEYRIEQRLWDNWSDFKDAHWDAFGFNAY
jgi:uncharacterized protein YukE